MRHRTITIFALAVMGALWSGSANALDWEIARNFRYFAYESDVDAHRVARDIYLERNHAAPTPEQLELLIDGKGFWSTPLSDAGALRDRWPLAWRAAGLSTVFDLIMSLRHDERRAVVADPDALGRAGWGSLLSAGRDARRPMGFSATCWDPATRLHDNCPRWGDYVRPYGWFVRVFDPAAPANTTCDWNGTGAVVVGATPPPITQRLRSSAVGASFATHADCREIALFVPSDASDPKAVAGNANVRRAAPDGSTVSLDVAPRDKLIIGFGDFFTSGEGNPERVAAFTGLTWSNGNLPARAPDPTSSKAPDTRAQWTDRWCHRSVYSWQVRAGLAAALANPKQSITLLPYGCSGATIADGLLYAFNGVEYDHSEDHGVVGSRAEIGLAYQELCRPDVYESSRTALVAPLARESDASASKEAAAAFAADQLRFIRGEVARCGKTNVFTRSADAVLLDIGINDVGFRQWAEALVLDKPLWGFDKAYIPCLDAGAPCDAKTDAVMARLVRRYALLRRTLDQYLLPEFGVDASHVVIPIYPSALQDERGRWCDRGNLGLTVATFPPSSQSARACASSPLLGLFTGLGGPLAAIRSVANVQSVEAGRLALNRRLGDFAGVGNGAYSLVTAHDARFASRGFCATAKGFALGAGQCLVADDFEQTPCAPGQPPSDPESMDAPRAQQRLDDCDARDTSAFHPFPASDLEPYRSRARLFRTMNDVYLMIDQRDKQFLDAGAFGFVDLVGRTTAGAFHPTAEAHALVATAALPVLCKAIDCGP